MATWDPFDYDSWYKTPLGGLCDAIEKAHIFSFAVVKPGDKALDAGCGTGIYTVELAKRGAAVYGVDNSMAMLSSAGAKADKEGLKMDLLAADATALPFRSGSFDMALSVGMLCFTEDAGKVLLEMNRVLRPGGRIVVGVLNRRSPWALFRRIKGFFKETVYKRARLFTPSQLKAALITAGFESVELMTCIHYLPFDSRPYLNLARHFETPFHFLSPYTGAFIAASAKKPL